MRNNELRMMPLATIGHDLKPFFCVVPALRNLGALGERPGHGTAPPERGRVLRRVQELVFLLGAARQLRL